MDYSLKQIFINENCGCQQPIEQEAQISILTPNLQQSHAIDPTLQLLEYLLAGMRCLHLLYYSCHWRSKGPNFYGDHLLFERLFGEVVPMFDKLAEKIVFLYGAEVLDFDGQVMKINSFLEGTRSNFNYTEDFYGKPLFFIDVLQEVIVQVNDSLANQGSLSLDWQDLLPEISSKLTEHTYLLNQTAQF